MVVLRFRTAGRKRLPPSKSLRGGVWLVGLSSYLLRPQTAIIPSASLPPIGPLRVIEIPAAAQGSIELDDREPSIAGSLRKTDFGGGKRSEEHTSELQSRQYLV